MNFFKSGFLIFTFWSAVFFILLFVVLWFASDEILKVASLISDQVDLNKDKQKTLEQLVSEGKLIPAKDYFGFYVSYYNNFVLILSAIIGLYGISSFVYFKQKSDESMREIEIKTREEVRVFLEKEDATIKTIIKEVAKESLESQAVSDYEKIKKDLDTLKAKIEEMKTPDLENQEISLKHQK